MIYPVLTDIYVQTCMYVCMYVCMCIYIYIYIYGRHPTSSGTKILPPRASPGAFFASPKAWQKNNNVSHIVTKSLCFIVTVFKPHFQSDECHRESDIDDSIPCSCVHTLEDAFSKVTNVTENLHSTFRFPVTVFTPKKTLFQRWRMSQRIGIRRSDSL